ncbi:phosphate transport regulator [Arsukibacterium sp. MJ3]|uniref:TIGR00153 family protein n=1 Tax=Arsukibacterium sp. MJ3 TaxID=1632859 RepID=UPI00062719F9|nr:TIGR00153 family protein [Arsukibacterium sp. MJ3]KKO48246.1 phosphate transport regulator [Arsukibacterium sp. MJ3]
MPGNTFLSVFAKSPIKPIEDHIRKVHEASEYLLPFFAAVYQKDWIKAAEVRKSIVDLEKEADRLKREIRINLPRGLFLPVDRTDILELVSQQDKIANKAKDISGRVLGRELEIPEAIQTDFYAYIQRCIDATAMASEVINELDELLETGFRGREVELVIKMVEKLDAIENDTDEMQIKLRKAVRAVESQLNPVDVMFLYRTVEWIGDLADIAQKVGARLEIMLAR